MVRINKFGQKIGDELLTWGKRELPSKINLDGRYCRLEPLDVGKHSQELFQAYSKAPNDSMWTYLPVGPFKKYEEYKELANSFSNSSSFFHYAVINRTNGVAIGTLSLMRADPDNGTIEIGYVIFSPELQRTTISTEAQYLLMKYALDVLKYRRVEWKCDNLNAPSRKAALRLGFNFEGTFRNAAIYKGRSRDTDWFSVIDKEWPDTRTSLETWLCEGNFKDGLQVRS